MLGLLNFHENAIFQILIVKKVDHNADKICLFHNISSGTWTVFSNDRVQSLIYSEKLTVLHESDWERERERKKARRAMAPVMYKATAYIADLQISFQIEPLWYFKLWF